MKESKEPPTFAARIAGALRWVALIPASLLVYALVSILSYAFALLGVYMFKYGRLGWAFFLGDLFGGQTGAELTFLESAYVNGMQGGLTGAALVYISARIAPSHKILVAYIFTGVAILISGALVIHNFTIHNPLWLWSYACLGIGAAIVAYLVRTGKVSFDK